MRPTDQQRRERVANGSRRKRDLDAVVSLSSVIEAAHRAFDAGSKLSYSALYVGALRLAGRGEALDDNAAIEREANAYLRQQKARCDAHIARSKGGAAG